MARGRVHVYAGDERSYIGYLYEVISGCSQQDCIRKLELYLNEARQNGNSASIPPNNQLDEGAGCRNESQVLSPTENLSSHTEDLPLPQSNGGIIFKLWQPTATEYKAATARRKPAAWEERTAEFFESLPTSEKEWIEKRSIVGMTEADDILDAVDALTSTLPSTGQALTHDKADRHERPDIQRGEPHLQKALCTFARCAGAAIVAGKFTRNVTHFYSQIFIATCDVALHEGHPEELVNAAQLNFLQMSYEKHEAGLEALARHRSTTRWLLQEQQRQFRRGLLHRAFDIFYNEGKDLSFYQKCPKRPEENEIFTKRIPLCEVPGEIQASIPFWIPFFVKVKVGDLWSYTKICSALGVDLLSKDEDFHTFKCNYGSRKLVIHRLSIDYPNPTQKRKRRNRIPNKPQVAPRTAASGTQVCDVQLDMGLGETGLRTPATDAAEPSNPSSSGLTASPDAECDPPSTSRCSSTSFSSGVTMGYFRPINGDKARPAKRQRAWRISNERSGFEIEHSPDFTFSSDAAVSSTQKVVLNNDLPALDDVLFRRSMSSGDFATPRELGMGHSVDINGTIDPRTDPLRWDHTALTSLEPTVPDDDDAGQQGAQLLLQLSHQQRSNHTDIETHTFVLAPPHSTSSPIFDTNTFSPLSLSEFIEYPSDEGE